MRHSSWENFLPKKWPWISNLWPNCFLLPDTHRYVRVSEVRNISLLGNFAYILNEWSLKKKLQPTTLLILRRLLKSYMHLLYRAAKKRSFCAFKTHHTNLFSYWFFQPYAAILVHFSTKTVWLENTIGKRDIVWCNVRYFLLVYVINQSNCLHKNDTQLITIEWNQTVVQQMNIHGNLKEGIIIKK